MPETSDEYQRRLAKFQELRHKGQDPFSYHSYRRTHSSKQLQESFAELEGQVVSVAGRLIAMRSHGKSTFADLQDGSGTIQIHARVDVLGEERYEDCCELDLGDIVGVSGELFATRTGEVTIRCEEFVLLAKALRPLPEKFHGLQNPELRYRQRYLDLLANEQVKEVFATRSRIIKAARNYLTEHDFLEVETPVLQPVYGGAAARPFTTHHNALNMQLYMRIAPELYLKRLIIGGCERVFEIGRVFRNEGIDTRHNPEFTILEAYQAYADYEDMMKLTENLVAAMCRAVHGGLTFTYQGKEIDLSPPWRRIPLLEAIKAYSGVELTDLTDTEAACRQAIKAGLEPERLAGQLSPHSSSTIRWRFRRWPSANLITRSLPHALNHSSAARRWATPSANLTTRWTSASALRPKPQRVLPVTKRPTRLMRISFKPWNTECHPPAVSVWALIGWSCC